MRTTVTLDPDVAMMLKKRMGDQNLTFKDTVNQTLRQGFKATNAREKLRPYKVVPHAFGFYPWVDQTKLGQLLDRLEVEDFVRKANRDHPRRKRPRLRA